MKHMNIIKRSCALILCLVMCVSYFCVFTVSSVAAEQEKTEVTSKVYPVTDDAHIRQDNGKNGENYNNETLGSGHGTKFADGKTKVHNVKYYSPSDATYARNIRTIFKFDLPTAEQAKAEGFNKVELTFTIARIADFASGDQTYKFYYATNVDWSEESVTWNSVIDSIPSDDDHLAGTFETKKGKDYSWMDKEDATIRIDITDLYLSLLSAERQTLTISIVGINSIETTMQIHDKESLDGTYGAKIVATSISEKVLVDLIDECDSLITKHCASSGVEAFESALESAKAAIGNENAIADAYTDLVNAKESLAFTKDYLVTQDGFIRSSKTTTVYNNAKIEAKNRNRTSFEESKLQTPPIGTELKSC